MIDTSKLTPKQVKACEGFIRGMSMRAAMVASGYNPSYCDGVAHVMRFLKNREIVRYIKARQSQIAEAEQLDKSELVKYARAIVADNDPKDRSKAVELLMRMGLPIADPATLTKDDIKSISINIEKV